MSSITNSLDRLPLSNTQEQASYNLPEQKLPNDVLGEILKHAHRKDFYNLSITCKYLNTNAWTVFDPSANDNEAIIGMSEKGNLFAVKALLKDSRVDPSAEKNLAIEFACNNNHVNVAKELLLDPRVDPSGETNYIIRDAVYEKNIDILEVLLNDGRTDPFDEGDGEMPSAFKQALERADEGKPEMFWLIIKTLEQRHPGTFQVIEEAMRQRASAKE